MTDENGNTTYTIPSIQNENKRLGIKIENEEIYFVTSELKYLENRNIIVEYNNLERTTFTQSKIDKLNKKVNIFDNNKVMR